MAKPTAARMRCWGRMVLDLTVMRTKSYVGRREQCRMVEDRIRSKREKKLTYLFGESSRSLPHQKRKSVKPREGRVLLIPGECELPPMMDKHPASRSTSAEARLDHSLATYASLRLEATCSRNQQNYRKKKVTPDLQVMDGGPGRFPQPPPASFHAPSIKNGREGISVEY